LLRSLITSISDFFKGQLFIKKQHFKVNFLFLFKGVMRNRCFFDFNRTVMGDLIDESFQNTYYKPEHTDSFICAEVGSGGMTTCAEIPPYINNSRICNGTIDLLRDPAFSMNDSLCVNWNAYYTKCRPGYKNPFKGAISFDNIGYAWVAIFQVKLIRIIFKQINNNHLKIIWNIYAFKRS
jgi:hypothetical protein